MKLPAIRTDALLLFLGTSMLPIYVFRSGGIQPTHVVLAWFAGLTLLTRNVPVTLWSLALFAVFLQSFIVESTYFIMGGKPEFMVNSLFFFYNCLLATAVYVYVRKNGLSALVPGILIAAGLAVGTIAVTGVDLHDMGDAGRATSTFHNPNQLGYFSVCLLSLAYLFYRHRHVTFRVAMALFAVSIFLAICSLSKAAMLANFIVILLALKPTSSRDAVLGWFVLAVVGGGALLAYRYGTFDEFLFMKRLANMTTEDDSSLESRGYFAFLQGNELQLLVGLGAQNVDQFIGHEVHSTLASVLNTYGFLGFLQFSLALAVWCLRLWRSYGLTGSICLAGPAMLYGISHNGTRFTIFWLLFAASLAMAQNILVTRAQNNRASSADWGRDPTNQC